MFCYKKYSVDNTLLWGGTLTGVKTAPQNIQRFGGGVPLTILCAKKKANVQPAS